MNNFVRNTGRDEYFRLREQETLRFVDPKTKELYSNLAKSITCPICNIDDSRLIFKKSGFKFVQCGKCGLIYVNPQLDENKLLNLYESSPANDLWIDVLLSEEQYNFNVKEFTEIIETVEKYTSGGKMLDLGCSIGLFLKIAKGRGWDTLGIELNERAIRHAREEFGLNIIDKKLEHSNIEDESFDVVTILGVLEHVSDPAGLLREINRVLKKNGILMILVPNVNSLAAKIMHEKTATFDGKNHLFYFSIDTLSKLVHKSGYEVLHTYTGISSIDPIINYMNYRDPYTTENTNTKPGLAELVRSLNLSNFEPEMRELNDEELRERIEKFIYDSNLGYRIYMFARKI